MDELLCCINELITSDDEKEKYKSSRQLYQLLYLTKLCDSNKDIFTEIILPKIYVLINNKRIKKDLVYLSLLPNNDKNVLQTLINFEKASITLDVKNSKLLFDYCLFKNKHWLLKIVEDETIQLENLFSEDFNVIVNILKLINVSNQFTIDLDKIIVHLTCVNSLHSSFIEFYTKELKRILDVVQMCQRYQIPGKVIEISEVYYYASCRSLLETFSEFLDLQSFDACDNILQKLKEYDMQEEFEIFTAYVVLFNILHCLKSCKTVNNDVTIKNKDDISNIIEQTQTKLVNLTNLRLQIEILENVFALLFLQLNLQSGFYCSEYEVRLILTFLNSTCDQIRRKNPYDKASEELKRFTKLNKYLVDAIWRLDLITNSNCVKSKIKRNIVSYMLASPESLIHLCLKQNDFNKANQVIQIFRMKNSGLALEIQYNMRLLNLKQVLKEAFKKQHIKKESSNLKIRGTEHSVTTIIEEFYAAKSVVTESESDTDVTAPKEPLIYCDVENLNFMNILDLVLTQCDSYEQCEEVANLALKYNTADFNSESDFSNFYKMILQVFTEINNKYTISVREILCNPYFDLDVEKFKAKESFFSELYKLCDTFNEQLKQENNNKFNSKHASHKTFLELQKLCAIFAGDQPAKQHVMFLQRLYNYLKEFSNIFYIEGNSTDLISKNKGSSFFSILNFSRSAILEKLLFEKKLDLYDFEQLFLKLKLDLVYHVATIFFPKINLSTDKDCKIFPDEIKNIETEHYLNSSIISYIQKQNWLLAFILNEMYEKGETNLNLNEIRIKTFLNFVNLPRIQQLKPLFNNNSVVTALQHQVAPIRITSYFEDNIVKLETEEIMHYNILSSQISTTSFETGEEIFEGDLKITDWKHLFDIINSVPQNQLRKNEVLLHLRDTILNELVSDCFEPDYFKYVRFISDNYSQWDCILNNLTTWPGEFCIDILKSELSRFKEIPEGYAEKFLEWCKKIELYESIRNILQKTSWYEIFSLCKTNPQEVFQSLLNTVEIDLLLKFIDINEINEGSLHTIDETYFVTLFDSSVNLSKIEELLNRLPLNHMIDTCYNLLKVLRKLEHQNFIANFISESNFGDTNLFKSIQISLKIISCFTAYEREQLWCLIADPISIIEILIMNTKLEKLGEVLKKVRPDIENCEFDENQLSTEKLDEILRAYAEKSVEFRVVLQPGLKLTRSPESSKLLQSLDSLNFPSGRKYFIMPETVPDKSNWVGNDEVTECMCCFESTFSMFNRRHHCRRCGRVICGNCSMKRMQVPTYENIQVRVCLDCYEQSHLDGAGTSSTKSEKSTKSTSCDYWLLTDDPNHNQIVREEFSYEYAPSVSLCLAILKHHSKTDEYAKFLLDQCDGMLQLLQPSNVEITQEIDYLLVIQMLKSLAIAAKMLCVECMIQWGTSLAEEILAQADLLGLLAERGCLHLVPMCSTNQSKYIDATILRRLRDKLLENEQWYLALEVSTKAGLDNSGVFAAWGKSYLKAGSLQLAREKFQRSFDKMAHYDNSTELSDSLPSTQLPQLRLRTSSVNETRPAKQPPLLNEIVHILESNTSVIDSRILREVKNIKPMSSSTWSLSSNATVPLQNDPAICILNKLKNLSNITAGNYCVMSDDSDSLKSLNVIKPHMEPIFYEECIYYLSKYGTHVSLIEFYIKHGDVHECLKHILNNRLGSDVFTEMYMLCLRENLVTALQENMSKIDSTLDAWKHYLKHICRHLEKQSKLHSLYQLQQFMGDFVRAAMTCIKFYSDGATTYSELTSRVDYLDKATQHLNQELEQDQWLAVATVRSLDERDGYEAKGIANPSLVMQMDSKNIAKHINTIKKQIEVSKFLAECEALGSPISEIIPHILPFINEDLRVDMHKVTIPTLFGSYYERVQLAVLTIVSGDKVEDGFGIAFGIIQDYKLSSVKVYCQAGKQLAKTENYAGIAQLVSCIRSSGENDSAITEMCDEMLVLAVQTLTKANMTGPQLDGLIKLITDRAAKISAYIETKQLKIAYLLAVKHKRMGDIRRVLREAEFLNQPNIKALCQKVLQAHSHSPSHSKD